MSVIIFHVVEDHGEELENDADGQGEEGCLNKGELQKTKFKI